MSTPAKTDIMFTRGICCAAMSKRPHSLGLLSAFLAVIFSLGGLTATASAGDGGLSATAAAAKPSKAPKPVVASFAAREPELPSSGGTEQLDAVLTRCDQLRRDETEWLSGQRGVS
jgi:hypothetical protein